MTPTQLSSSRPAGAAGLPVIVGAGLAGLVTALRLAPQPCVVLSAGSLGHGAASGWAQGGIAAALADDDSAELHARDTLAAGVGLCEPVAVSRITSAAPAAVAYLSDLGARFDRDRDGRYRLGLEGAHSRHRIVHAKGDGTGAEILRAVVEAVRATPSITVLEDTRARRLIVDGGHVVGVLAEAAGRQIQLTSSQVVLATGGSGQLWQHTTNPRGSRGLGLALAARAGAELRDLEMVQFHPTALDIGIDPMPLVSEAVRGAGALLVDAAGDPLTDDPLAARDVVARVVWGAVSRGEHVFLDARTALGERFAASFPTVSRACLAAGVDPAAELIPIRPAAHYQCGGVTVDLRGRTTVPGLWAVGEVASTGLHGANRLASNSLLEAVVCGGWVADDLADRECTNPDRECTTPDRECTNPDRECTTPDRECTGSQQIAAASPGSVVTSSTWAPPTDGRSDHGWPRRDDGSPRPDEIRALMTRAVGILRDGLNLAAADSFLTEMTTPDPEYVDDTILVALLVTRCAVLRQESRGGHTRLDYPQTDDMAAHTAVALTDVLPSRVDQAVHLVPVGATR